jgi:very-short-patch-repair endonuclease
LYDFTNSNFARVPNQRYSIITNIHCKKCDNDFSKTQNNNDINTFNIKTTGTTLCPICTKNEKISKNNIKQKNWLESSLKIHLNDKGKPKYGYDRVDFNDPNTIYKKYNPITGELISSERKFEIFCPESKHGYFLQSAKHHRNGSGCPICKESKGEQYLRNLFLSKNIKFNRQKKYNGFGDLPFDFYLPKYNVLIEYDGEQHFQPTFGSTDSTRMINYSTTYRNDNIKNEFINTNNRKLSLIRIPYTMEMGEIDKLLMRTLRYIKSNTIVELGDYPKRMKPKTILAKNQVDLNKPIIKPRRVTESKLSLINTLYENYNKRKSNKEND